MKSIYQFIIVFSFFLFLFSCNQEQETATITDIEEQTEETSSNIISITQEQFDSSKFVIGKMEEKEFSAHIPVTGTIHLPEKNSAAVNSIIEGTLSKMDLVDGEWVSKGQELFRVTNPELLDMQEEYLVFGSDLNFLRKEYSRQQELIASKVKAAKNILPELSAQIQSKESRYAALKEKLSLYGINVSNITANNLISSIPIYSPTSGYASEISAMKGLYVEKSKTLLKIINTSNKQLELSVLEKDINQLKKGQEISFFIQSDPSKKYKATIALIHQIVGENHLAKVYCNINGKDAKQLAVGIFATAEIMLQKNAAQALPQDAITDMDEESYVLLYKGKEADVLSFEKVMIEKGIAQNDYIEIINHHDFTPDSKFLTKGSYYLIVGE